MRRGFPFNLLRNASLLNVSNPGRVIFANSKRACAASFSSFAARSLASALNLPKASSLSLPDFCENPHADYDENIDIKRLFEIRTGCFQNFVIVLVARERKTTSISTAYLGDPTAADWE